MIIILIVIIVVLVVVVITTGKRNNFESPKSLTVCEGEENLCTKNNVTKIIKGVNYVGMPSYFSAGEKWPGCLPRPLYQGTCGSCWGFASVTCLSSRFFIESCGNSGCNDYPQINMGSFNNVLSNINQNYKFRKIYLEDIFKLTDKNKDTIITLQEWLDTVGSIRNKIFRQKINKREKHFILQLLIFMLDFQSLGSVNIGSHKDVINRGKKTYNIWLKLTKSSPNQLNIEKLRKLWNSEPISLSAEKLIACCINCMQVSTSHICQGGSLIDAWILLRDTGTTTTSCIGYNMDNYVEGMKVPNCKQLQGPLYSFCSGYVYDDYDTEYIDKKIKSIEESNIFPIAVPNDDRLPWIDTQLFRFRAKNAYKIENDMYLIQKEIIERGPVTTGFLVYDDFQTDFGQNGMGGQKFAGGTNPLGSLIYIHYDKSQKSLGGHAITLVGWGTYVYEEYNIPYWICLNSWGIEWGHSGFPKFDNRGGLPEDLTYGGYFWMVRGINNCGIESNVVAGQPNIDNISYPGISNKYGWGFPGPDIPDKYFLPSYNFKVADSGSLDVSIPLAGGGTYVNYENNKWEMKSMNPPSPYVLFWPDNRPTYCVGEIQNDIDDIKEEIDVDKSTYSKLLSIASVSKNPFLIINNEQVQLIELSNGKIFVTRGINFTQAQPHKKKSIIKIFPYQTLDNNFFVSNGFEKCSNL
jgi:hypothetical protein